MDEIAAICNQSPSLAVAEKCDRLNMFAKECDKRRAYGLFFEKLPTIIAAAFGFDWSTSWLEARKTPEDAEAFVHVFGAESTFFRMLLQNRNSDFQLTMPLSRLPVCQRVFSML